jgi:hypothetical protein
VATSAAVTPGHSYLCHSERGHAFVSDVIEAIQGGFSEGQLWLTLFAEAVIPIFVIGLAAAQRPRLGRLRCRSRRTSSSP